MVISPQEILDFWFKECSYQDWFKASPSFDEILIERFSDINDVATNGGCDDWASYPKGCLALIIVLDQFTRNIFRGKAEAFKNDQSALRWTKFAIEEKYMDAYTPKEVHICLLPLIHSENLADHRIANELGLKLLSRHPRYKKIKKTWDDHRVPIERFGRYPHRNNALGRESTAEELTFLNGPNSSW